MSEQNKAIARKVIEDAWNGKDMSVIDQLVAPNHVPHGPFTDQYPQGVEGAKALVSTFLAAFPDTRATINKQETDGDLVKTTVTFTGTQTSPLMNIPATGKKATVQVLVTDRIVGGKIVETWSEWDPAELMRQLGVEQTGGQAR